MGYNPHFKILRFQLVADSPRSPGCLDDPLPTLLPLSPSKPGLWTPVPTHFGTSTPTQCPPTASSPHPRHVHQLLWFFHSRCCLGFNFCVAVRKLPIITALRGNVSWLRPCSQLWSSPTKRLRRDRGLQGLPAQILALSKDPHFNDEGGCFHLLWRGKTIIRRTQNSLPNDYCKILYAQAGVIQWGGRAAKTA